MKAFRWYNLICYLLLSFLLKKVTTEDGYALFEDIYRAVTNSFDVSLPFEENTAIILRSLCTHLSAASCDDESQEKYVRLPIVSNTSSDVNNIAREFIKENAHYLGGCCGKCSCGSMCYINGNCCNSKLSQSKVDNSNHKQPKSRCVDVNIKSYLTSHSIFEFPKSYLMVSTCLNENVDIDIVNRCLQPNILIPDEIIPVVSYTSKIIYLNHFCAQCNHENSTVDWEVQITFNSPNFALSHPYNKKLPESISDFFKLGMSKDVDINFIPPVYLNLSHDDYGCNPETQLAFTHCNSSGKQIYNGIAGDQIMDRACSSTNIPFTTALYGHLYRNVFCYLCNIDYVSPKIIRECKSFSRWRSGTALTGIINFRHTEEKGIDDKVDDNKLVNVANQRKGNCTCQEIFDEKKIQCRKVYCPFMERYAGCLCSRFISDLDGYTVNAFFEVRPLLNSYLPNKWKNVNKKDVVKLKSALKKRFWQMGSISIKYLAVYQISDRSGDFYYFASRISPKSGFESLEILSDVYTRLRNGIPLSLGQSTFVISIGKLFEWKFDSSSQFGLSENKNIFKTERLFSVSERKLFTAMLNTDTLSQLLFCKRILLTDNETEVFTNSTNLTKNGITRNINNVYFRQGSDGVDICFEDFVELFQESTDSELSFSNDLKVSMLLISLCFAVFVSHSIFETHQ